jgi:hypothetical protein
MGSAVVVSDNRGLLVWSVIIRATCRLVYYHFPRLIHAPLGLESELLVDSHCHRIELIIALVTLLLPMYYILIYYLLHF